MTIVRGEVAGFYNDLETSMMETIAAFAAAWPEYRQRVLEKFAERSKSGPLEVAILGEDLGALNAHVGTLLKDGQSKPKSVFHRLIASSARIDRKRINQALDDIRAARRPWVHGGNENVDDAVARTHATLLLRSVDELWSAGFEHLLPEVVVVVGSSDNIWGHHLQLVGDEPGRTIAYCVEVAPPLLTKLYLLSATNPAPVRPALLPSLVLRARPSHLSTRVHDGRNTASRR